MSLPKEFIVHTTLETTESDEVMNYYRKPEVHLSLYEDFHMFPYVIIGYENKEGLNVFNRIKKDVEQFPIFTYKQWKELISEIDYTIPGTVIPTIPKGMDYKTVHKSDNWWKWGDLDEHERVSFGTKNIGGIECLLVDQKGYTGSNYLVFKLEDIKNIKMEKEILGYILSPEGLEFEKAAKKIADCNLIIRGCGTSFSKNSRVYDKLKEAEILDKWFTPIYKKEIVSKKIELGLPSRSFEVFKDKIEMIDGNGNTRSFLKNDLEELIAKVSPFIFKHFSCDFTSLQIGCGDGVLLAPIELKTLQNTQNAL